MGHLAAGTQSGEGGALHLVVTEGSQPDWATSHLFVPLSPSLHIELPTVTPSFTVTFVVIDYINVRGGNRACILQVIVLRLVWLLHHHGSGVVRQVVSRGVPNRAVINHLPTHLSLDDVRFLWNVCVLLLLPIDPTTLLMTFVVQDDSRVHLGISNTPVLHLLVADF